jgi:hypothetical protein
MSDPAAYMNRLQSALSAWFALAANGLSQMATLDFVKVNNIGADGKYSSPTTNMYVYPSLIRGGTTVASSTYPLFVTCVATFLTDVGRGRASRGRISLPFALDGAVSASSLVGNTNKSRVATGVKALLTSCVAAGAPEGAYVPTVYSSVGGEFSAIRQIRVGNRFDTLNRRKNAIPEAPYTQVAAP